MSTAEHGADAPALQLAHIEIRVERLAPMVDFYTNMLGFVVTDASSGPSPMVFLSRSPDEHHQLVLTEDRDSGTPRRIDHIAFRLASLHDLRAYRHRIEPLQTETVSHGTSWSVYVTDPEHNRLEFFCDTPWHVRQPARWPVDLDDAELNVRRSTREHVASMPAFTERSAWMAEHRQRVEPQNASSHIGPETAGHGATVAIDRVNRVDRDDPDATRRPQVALSSHRTETGILTYYRQPDGRTVARLRQYS